VVNTGAGGLREAESAREAAVKALSEPEGRDLI